MTRAVLLVAVSLAVLVGVAGQTPAGRTPSSSDSVMIQTFAPLLASWIAYERDAAKKQGAEPIPPPIRAALEGYVPEPILVMKREGLIPKVQAAERSTTPFSVYKHARYVRSEDWWSTHALQRAIGLDLPLCEQTT